MVAPLLTTPVIVGSVALQVPEVMVTVPSYLFLPAGTADVLIQVAALVVHMLIVLLQVVAQPIAM